MKSLSDHLNKKGQLSGLSSSIIALVVAIIILVIGLVVIQELRDVDSLRSGAGGCNATAIDSLDCAARGANISLIGLGDLSDFVPIIVIAIAASIIIGLILVGFAFGGRQR